MRYLRIPLVGLLALAALLAASPAATANPGTTERVSVDSAGNHANGESFHPAISADGRFVAFESYASNLVGGDTNGDYDIFVHDRQTGTTERVSVDSTGNQGNSWSFGPAISADGRFVAFWSSAWNLVAGDTNSIHDIIVHDRQTGTTERLSVDSAGSQANGESFYPAISADGRFVAFTSYASNLVAGDTIGFGDVFVHDRQTGVTERVSLDSVGNQGVGDSFDPAISADGRYVAFSSYASGLVPGDIGPGPDVFVHDRQTGLTERASVDSGGNPGNYDSDDVAITADGRFVAFKSYASNLVAEDTNSVPDVFVHDRQTGLTERVSVDSTGGQANDPSFRRPAISGDGRYVAFQSSASNLVAEDTNSVRDMFVHDRQTSVTERVSVDSAGNEANGESRLGVAISVSGRFVAFSSSASNLVVGDTNWAQDIFVHDRGAAVITVDIDVKPGSDPNSTNLGSQGVIPVAILTTPDFDAADVDPATVEFEGASALHDGLEDVDGDGDLDLIMHFRTQDADIAEDAPEACLTGETTEGQPIEGCDAIRIVPPSLDSDDDGFGDAVEATVTTDQFAACPTSPAHAAWPPDFNDDQVVNLLDLNKMLPPPLGSWGATPGDPAYSVRRDLVPDGVINLPDLNKVLPAPLGSWGQTCTP